MKRILQQDHRKHRQGKVCRKKKAAGHQQKEEITKLNKIPTSELEQGGPLSGQTTIGSSYSYSLYHLPARLKSPPSFLATNIHVNYLFRLRRYDEYQQQQEPGGRAGAPEKFLRPASSVLTFGHLFIFIFIYKLVFKLDCKDIHSSLCQAHPVLCHVPKFSSL